MATRTRQTSETSIGSMGFIDIRLPDNATGPEKLQGDTRDKTLEGAHLFGVVYAMVIVILGMVFPLAEALHDQWLYTWYTAGFSVYLLVVGSGVLVFAQFCLGHEHDDGHEHIDSHDHGHDNHGLAASGLSSSTAISINPNPAHNGSATPNGMVTHVSSAIIRRSPSMEAFEAATAGKTSDPPTTAWVDLSKLGNIFSHEGSSLYLRFGALVFGLGNFIYLCLELEANYGEHDCEAPPYSWIFAFRLLFLVVQTFFLFKNPDVHVVRYHTLVRLGFMHVIATNLCVWVRTLTEEILHEYHHLNHVDPPATNSTQVQARVSDDCVPDTIITTAGPYLFAFVLEYSLIAMGTFTIMYIEVGQDKVNDIVRGIKNFMKVSMPMVEEDADNSFTSDSHSTMGFPKSHRGVFAGIVFMSVSIVCIVLFYYYLETDGQKSVRIYFYSDIALHVLMLVATIMVLIYIRKFSFIPKPASVDDVLLLVGFIGYLIAESSLILGCASYLVDPEAFAVEVDPQPHALSDPLLQVAANDAALTPDQIEERVILGLVSGIVSMCAGVTQVFLVLVGLRCYCMSDNLLKRAPGRGIIAFLVVSNVAMWVFRTAQVKQIDFGIHGLTFGDLAWLLLMNISLPLMLFYHFHASVCFADIWHTSYEPLPLHKVRARPEKLPISRPISHSSLEDAFEPHSPEFNNNTNVEFSMGGTPFGGDSKTTDL